MRPHLLSVCLALLLACAPRAASPTFTLPATTSVAATQSPSSPSPTPDECRAGRAYLAVAANNLSKVVAQVEGRTLAMTEAVGVLALLGGEIASKDLAPCVKAGQDALIDVIIARRDAYRYFIDGNISRARASLDAEDIALTRYIAWRDSR